MASAAPSKSVDMFDGRRLKALTADSTKFKQYIDSKFAKLGGSSAGVLSAEQLKPAVAEWGSWLGLPPMGTSADTDEIYKELTRQYLDASKQSSGSVGKATFEVVTRDILLGISDSLEANPITVDTIDGSQLRHVLADAQKPEFQLLADGAYEAINTQVIDQRSVTNTAGTTKGTEDAPAASEAAMGSSLDLSAEDALSRALKQHLTIKEGVPPASSQKVEALIDRAIQGAAGSQQGGRLNKEGFTGQLRVVLERLAEGLQAEPVTVAHIEKDIKGERIKPLMEDKEGFARAVSQIFEEHSQNGKVPHADFWTAFDRVAALAGLPPLGASEKMDDVYDTVIGNREASPGAYSNAEELGEHLKESLFLVGARLTAEPISLKVAQVVGDPNDTTSQSAQRLQQVGTPADRPVGGAPGAVAGQSEAFLRPVGGSSVPTESRERSVGAAPGVVGEQINQNERPVVGAPGGVSQREEQVLQREEQPVTSTGAREGKPLIQWQSSY